MTKLALAFDILANDTKAARTLDQFGNKAEHTAKRVHHVFAHLKGELVGAVAGFATIEVFKGFVESAEEARKQSRLTAQVIKTTGKVAHITAKNVDDLAAAISGKSGVDREQIHSAENLLLIFTKVRNEVGKGNDIFTRATQTATDMAVALGTAPRDAALKLGKALNDPIRGLTALSRAGVQFTAQQKEQIKALVDSGHTLEAQKLILDSLSKKFAGAAAAAATPTEKLHAATHELGVEIGTFLLPAVDATASFLQTKGIPALEGFLHGMRDGTGAGGKFAAVVKDIGHDAEQAWDKAKPIFSFIGDHPKLFAELAKDGLILAAALKGISAVKKIPGLGSVLGKGPLGIASVAKPVPVFVTNSGFGLPGGGPKGRGKIPPIIPKAGLGAIGLGIGSVLLTSGDAGPASDAQKRNREFIIALNRLADSKGQYDKARLELLKKAGGINFDTSDSENHNRVAIHDLVAEYDFLVKYGKKTIEVRHAIRELAQDPAVSAALKERARQTDQNIRLVSGGLLKLSDIAATSTRSVGESLSTNVGTGVRHALELTDRLDSAVVRLGTRHPKPLVTLTGAEKSQKDAQSLFFYLQKLNGKHVRSYADVVFSFKQGQINNPATRQDKLDGARANGGRVLPGRGYWVGERGPEPFYPDQPGRIVSHEKAMAGGVSFGEVHITVADNRTALSVPEQLRNSLWLRGLG